VRKRVTTATPHERTRRDHAVETAEDYVEAVAEIIAAAGQCRVVDLARKFSVSHVTVTRTVGRLQQEGLVSTEPYRPIELTTAGKQLATTSRHRHETVLAFLRALGVSPQAAAIDTEGIEHHVGEETLAAMKHFLRQAEVKD
jgi:DtxR family manganese transport transcriptional regulator